MPDGLKKKIGPLPLWAWALIAGAAIGGFILISRRGTADATAPDLTNQPILDPTTGQPIAGEGGGGSLTSPGTAPTLAQEVSDVTGIIGMLRDAGFFTPANANEAATANVAGAGPGLIDIAPGHRYYDPNTGETIDGPEAKAVKSATAGKTNTTKKPTALDRAMTAVQAGKVGPVNRQRLRKAGFSDAQIDYHVKHKTPLGKPVKQAKAKAASTPTTVAPHSQDNHNNVKAPNHSAPAPVKRKGTDSHGHPGTWNLYPGGRKVFVPA